MSGGLNVGRSNRESPPHIFLPQTNITIVLTMVDFTDPHTNLLLEDFILDYIAKSNASINVIRFWRNSECLVAGPRRSKHYGWYREDVAMKMGIRVFTRSTAGGVVFHDLGNLNWSFYIKTEKTLFIPPLEIFKSAASIICHVLKRLGANAYFTPPNRIDVNGRKISGMAARSSSNALLVHGTLLFETDLDKLNKLCIPPPNCPPVTNLRKVNKRLTIQDFIIAFCEYLKSSGYELLVFDIVSKSPKFNV